MNGKLLFMQEYLPKTKGMILKIRQHFCVSSVMPVDQCIEDYGSGLDYNRKKWNGLLDKVMEQMVKTIVITHKDRFIRFGYDWFERFCMKFHTTILAVNNEELSTQENSCRISLLSCMNFPVDYMDFVNIRSR